MFGAVSHSLPNPWKNQAVPSSVETGTELIEKRFRNYNDEEIIPEIFDRMFDEWAEATDLHKSQQEARMKCAHIYKAKYPYEYVIDLTNIGIDSLPKIAGYLKGVEHIFLYQNKFLSFPSAVCSYQNLRRLLLSCNQIQSIPDEIGALVNLKILELDFNMLTSISTSIGSLKSLYKLLLNGNQLESIPDEIGSLVNLMELDLSHNKLKSIPASLGALKKLEKLKLDLNQLRYVPDSLGSLPNLSYLSLSFNQLTFLPATYGRFPQIFTLDISYNPNLVSIPMTCREDYNFTYLYGDHTNLPSKLCDAIEQRQKEYFKSYPHLHLSNRWKTWKAYANVTFDFWFRSFDIYTKDQKDLLSKWLMQLEGSKGFERSRAELAQVVYKIVKDLGWSQEFREIFFPLVAHNLEICDAWVLLNTIFVKWKLREMTSPRDKYLLLAGIAKTLVLKSSIRNFETFLHYETTLQKPLGLVTAVVQSSFRDYESQTQINVDELIDTVNNTYTDKLITLTDFEELLEQVYGSEYNTKKAEIVANIRRDDEEIRNTTYPSENKRDIAIAVQNSYKTVALPQLRKEYAQKLSIGK